MSTAEDKKGAAAAPVPQHKRWEDSFRRLKAFRKEHGHCDVPFRYAPDTKLGRWVAFQRTMYRRMREGKTEKISLTPERISRLEKVGFEWSIKPQRDTVWDDHYLELVAFKKEFNHCQVPIDWERNPHLARWVMLQRHEGRLFQEGSASQLNQEQVAKLKELGFQWNEKSQRNRNHSETRGCGDTSHSSSSSAGDVLSTRLVSSRSGMVSSPGVMGLLSAALGGSDGPMTVQQQGRPCVLASSLPVQPSLSFPEDQGLHMVQKFPVTLPSVDRYQNAIFAQAGTHQLHDRTLRGASSVGIGASGSDNHTTVYLPTHQALPPLLGAVHHTSTGLNAPSLPQLHALHNAPVMIQSENGGAPATCVPIAFLYPEASRRYSLVLAPCAAISSPTLPFEAIPVLDAFLPPM